MHYRNILIFILSFVLISCFDSKNKNDKGEKIDKTEKSQVENHGKEVNPFLKAGIVELAVLGSKLAKLPRKIKKKSVDEMAYFKDYVELKNIKSIQGKISGEIFTKDQRFFDNFTALVLFGAEPSKVAVKLDETLQKTKEQAKAQTYRFTMAYKELSDSGVTVTSFSLQKQ